MLKPYSTLAPTHASLFLPLSRGQGVGWEVPGGGHIGPSTTRAASYPGGHVAPDHKPTLVGKRWSREFAS